MAIDFTGEPDECQEDPPCPSYPFKEPYQALRSSNNGGPLGFPRTESGAGGINSRIENLPIASTSTGISSHHHHHHHNYYHLKKQKKKLLPAGFLSFDMDVGKRKRSGGRGDKGSSDSSSGGTFPLMSCPSEFQSMIGIGMDLMNVDDMIGDGDEDELMKGEEEEEEDVSSLSSGSESIAPSCDEGREGIRTPLL